MKIATYIDINVDTVLCIVLVYARIEFMLHVSYLSSPDG